MPIIQSAKKRVRVAKRQAIENSRTRRNVRMSIKKFQEAVADKKGVDQAQNEAQSALDTAVKKGVISKNKAARKKSQLNSAANKVNGGKRKAVTKKTAAKPTPKKKPAAKTATKKPAAKKALAKKPTAKKSAAKTQK